MTISILNKGDIIQHPYVVQYADDDPQPGRKIDLLVKVASASDDTYVDQGPSTSGLSYPIDPAKSPASGEITAAIHASFDDGVTWSENPVDTANFYIGDQCNVTAERQSDGTVDFTNNESEEVEFTVAGVQRTLAAGESLNGVAGITESEVYIACQSTGGGGGGVCTAGFAGIFGSSAGMYTLANMKNWTNPPLGIPFTNVDHTIINSVRVHTTSRTSSYYNGNGGTFKFHIYSDNNGIPGTLLRSTPTYIGATSLSSTGGPWSSKSAAESAYPGAIWSSYGETGNDLVYHRRYNLSDPLSVTPGDRYWIVMERTTSTSHGVSLNGFFTGQLDKNDDPRTGFFNVGDWVIKTGSGASWSTIDHHGIFEVYGDGMTIGNAHHEVSAFTDTDKSNNINGSSAARQVWVPHRNMEIARIRLSAGRRSGSADIAWQIKNATLNVLRSGTLSGFPTVSGTDARTIARNLRSASSDFTPLAISAGQTYYLEFKTSSGTHYEVGMTRDGVLSGHYNVNPEYHGWGPNSVAQVSYNNGSSWVLPTNWSGTRNYLSVEADVQEWKNGSTTCIEDIGASGSTSAPSYFRIIEDTSTVDIFDNDTVTTGGDDVVYPNTSGLLDITESIGIAMAVALAKETLEGDPDDHVIQIDNSNPNNPRVLIDVAQANQLGQTSINVDLKKE